jgi:glycosyltransferase involved in cell wall biosynthesis
VLWLAKALRDLKHDVSVVCLSGSRLPDGVRAIEVSPGETSPSQFFSSPEFRRLPAVDIVHFMAPPGNEFLNSFAYPHLVTVHGNGKIGEVFPRNTCFLSENHATRHNRKTFVYNGIDPDEYEYSEAKRDQFLFLSKTSWRVKNLKGAMDIADRAGVHLKITGGNRPISLRMRSFFSRHDWVGPVSGEQKAELLRDSRGLIFPVLWDEPFGLVTVEALVSGTPVFGPNRGSLTELIPSSVGVLYSPTASLSEQVEAFQSMNEKRSRDCQEWVRSRFTHLHMAKSYVKIYESILNQKEEIL